MKRHLQFTMHRASGLTLQRHQILRLPRKMTRMIDARHIWNVIYNARSNRHHPPTSPNTAPATQNCIPKSKRNLPKTVQASLIYTGGRFENDWEWSEHDPSMKLQNWTRPFAELTFPFARLGNAFCIENYNISRCGYLPKIYQILRLPRKVTPQHHQMLRLPPRMTLMIDARRTWNVIYNLQCTGHQDPPSNVTKYCACHVKWHAWLMPVTYETSFTMRRATGLTLQPHQILRQPRKIALQNLREICLKLFKRHLQWRTIREWSENDPNMIRAWNCKTETGRSPSLLSPSGHEKWRSNITKCCACHLEWLSWLMPVAHETSFTIYNAQGIRTHPPTSPNTAPAT